MNRIMNWSFSKLMVFESCPYHAYLQWVEKIPDKTERPAADRGTDIHLQAENYIRHKKSLTDNLQHFEEELNALKTAYAEGKVSCEEEWGFDIDWQPCAWSTAWLRLKCDVVCHINKSHTAVIDFKTGKRFGNELKHAQQLQLYALCTLLRYPEVKRTTNELWYLDKNELVQFSLTRSQIARYLQIFDKRGRAITEAQQYPARPNVVSCRWCPYAPQRQGDCEYGVDVEKVQTTVSSSQSIEITKPKRDKTSHLFKNEDLSRYL